MVVVVVVENAYKYLYIFIYNDDIIQTKTQKHKEHNIPEGSIDGCEEG